MEQETIQLLFALLRSTICGVELKDEEKALFSEDRLPELFAISDRHDMSHLLGFAAKQNALTSSYDDGMKKSMLKAVYRYERLNHEVEKVCRVLESAEIPFMPLKGAVLHKYYPEAWMRTSCDVDILVHKEDTEKAVSLLENSCGCTRGETNAHDVSLFTPGKEHIELHYDLIEDGLVNASSQVLRSVWETAVIRRGHGYWYEMPDEMFYFYHVAHMAKHIENGGCGIRPFVDLWILNGIEGADRRKRDELLRQGGLLKFERAACRLSMVWMGGAEPDSLSRQLEQYILCGGVYGTNKNRITMQQQKRGGALRYALSRIFLPYDTIKFHYPVLQKHRWLLPLMQVHRWGKLLFFGHTRRVLRELKYNRDISMSEAEAARYLLENIGL